MIQGLEEFRDEFVVKLKQRLIELFNEGIIAVSLLELVIIIVVCISIFTIRKMNNDVCKFL